MKQYNKMQHPTLTVNSPLSLDLAAKIEGFKDNQTRLSYFSTNKYNKEMSAELIEGGKENCFRTSCVSDVVIFLFCYITFTTKLPQSLSNTV